MIWEIVKKGWNSWRNHKVSGIPFFISGVVSSLIFLGTIVSVVYMISPELFELLLSGDISEEYITELLERYAENFNTIVTVAGVAFILFVIVDTFFRTWGIKLCSSSLECKADLSETLRDARSRFLPFLTFNFMVGGIALAGLVPFYYIFRDVNWASSESVAVAVILSITYGFVWLGLVTVILFLTTFAPYAIVVDGRGVFDGIKRGFKVLSNSLAETVIMWLMVGLAGMAAGIPFYPLRFIGAVGEIASTVLTWIVTWLVISPVVTMWWVELYRRKASQL